MAERRRYTKHQKLSAVMASDMLGVVAASDQSGIPATTIEYWLHKPEFAEFRTKTREDLVEEVGLVAHLAWQRVAEALKRGDLEPRDALFAADKATTLYQLVTGEATQRAETRDITDTLDDHERDALRKVLDEVMANAGS